MLTDGSAEVLECMVGCTGFREPTGEVRTIAEDERAILPDRRAEIDAQITGLGQQIVAIGMREHQHFLTGSQPLIHELQSVHRLARASTAREEVRIGVGGNRHRVDRWGRFRFESFSFDVLRAEKRVSIHVPITGGRLRPWCSCRSRSDAEHTSRPNSRPPSTYHPNQIRLCPSTSPVESSLLQLGCMASRNFADQSGVNWHVWNTVPVSGAVINPGFEKGWLTFEAETGLLRRLAPVPEGWEDVPRRGCCNCWRDRKRCRAIPGRCDA